MRLAAVEYVHVNDPVAASNAMLAGQIDAVDNAQAQTERAVKGQKGITTLVKVSESTQMLAAWCRSTGPLADVRVRQAMNYAIDRDAINKVVYAGLGEPMDSLVSSDTALYNPRYKNYYGRNIDKAKKLLADAFAPGNRAIPSTRNTLTCSPMSFSKRHCTSSLLSA